MRHEQAISQIFGSVKINPAQPRAVPPQQARAQQGVSQHGGLQHNSGHPRNKGTSQHKGNLRAQKPKKKIAETFSDAVDEVENDPETEALLAEELAELQSSCIGHDEECEGGSCRVDFDDDDASIVTSGYAGNKKK